MTPRELRNCGELFHLDEDLLKTHLNSKQWMQDNGSLLYIEIPRHAVACRG